MNNEINNNNIDNNANPNGMNYGPSNIPNNNNFNNSSQFTNQVINNETPNVPESLNNQINEIPQPMTPNIQNNNNQNINNQKKNNLPIIIAILVAAIIIIIIILIFIKKINFNGTNETGNNNEQNNTNSNHKTTTTKKNATQKQDPTEIKNGYVYTFPNNLFIGDAITKDVSAFADYQDYIDLYKRNYFIRNKIEDGYVAESYIGFIYNDKVYYLRGGDNGKYYQESLNTLKAAFGAENCKDYTTQAYSGRAASPAVVCSAPDMFVRAIKDGEVNAGTSQRECSVGPDEFAISHCY